MMEITDNTEQEVLNVLTKAVQTIVCDYEDKHFYVDNIEDFVRKVKSVIYQKLVHFANRYYADVNMVTTKDACRRYMEMYISENMVDRKDKMNYCLEIAFNDNEVNAANMANIEKAFNRK